MKFLSADVGGTFTDLVLIDNEAGRSYVDKVPSGVRGTAAAIAKGIHQITQSAGLTPRDIDLFVHGFTVSTNAFLMGTGAKAALITTNGFRDVLEVGNQLRPALYSVTTPRTAPIIERTRILEANERVDSFGDIVTALDDADIDRLIGELEALAPDAIAISLAFAHLNPTHEQKIAARLAQALPDTPVYMSHQVNPQIEEWPRANTTSIAAYVGPIVNGYVTDLEKTLDETGLTAPLRIMRSDGGIATPLSARENPAHTLLSGPAGGVVASEKLCNRLGYLDAITFDMGGTSADFSAIVDGEPKTVGERRIKGQPLRLPTLDVETISAGGGSTAWIDMGGGLKVGPDSAGSVPGPACYPQGGSEPTTTDAAVVLGYLHADDYLGGRIKLDRDAAAQAIKVRVADPLGLSIEDAALGIVLIASAGMVQGIRTLCVERGIDPRRFWLLAFGGAGPLFAGFLARDLQMEGMLVPPHPGVFAAEGLLMSDLRHTVQQPFGGLVTRGDDALRDALSGMRSTVDAALARDGIAQKDRSHRFYAGLRYVGQFHEIKVPVNGDADAGVWDADAISNAFHAEHNRIYGHNAKDSPVEFVSLHADAVGKMDRPAETPLEMTTQGEVSPTGSRKAMFSRDGFVDTQIYDRTTLPEGYSLQGPAIITQLDSTTVVAPGETATVLEGGTLKIELGETL